MALFDVLAARANAARATARVACGSLGEVTLEALSVRDIERLSRGGDADRAIFYAACRDLQRVGAELMRAGKVYQPDQVTALVSGEEASIAAQRVRELSRLAREASPADDSADAAANEDSDRGEAGQVSDGSEVSEVRLQGVQENAKVRHDTVQQDLTENGEIRLSSVQASGGEDGDGQVSREFLTEEQTEIAKPDGVQVLWSGTEQTPQNVAKMDKMDSGLRNIEPFAAGKQTVRGKKKSNRAHESKSEFKGKRGSVLHESESELTRGDVALLHETESDFAETLHENKSEFRKNVHENKSEFAEMLHENESELAERVARGLLEGLRRASWVR